MTEITAKMVSTLRERTGAPMMKCKIALVEADGDLSHAETRLREQGMKATPVAQEGNQGYIAAYIHHGNQLVGMVELACTTDFVSRSEEFRAVAKELAMQVAASAPLAISVDDLPDDTRENALTTAQAQVKVDPKTAGKSPALQEEIAQKKAAKSLEEQCLLTQPYIRDPKVAVGTLIENLKLQVREGIYVRRISRWRVGETL